jgi:hypothetical protein
LELFCLQNISKESPIGENTGVNHVAQVAMAPPKLMVEQLKPTKSVVQIASILVDTTAPAFTVLISPW